MLQLLGAGKQQTKWENVDLDKLLADSGLKTMFDVDEWPSVNAVRELATRVKKAAECLPSGDKSARPFVFTGLKQYVLMAKPACTATCLVPGSCLHACRSMWQSLSTRMHS